jgi:hypothetical protein
MLQLLYQALPVFELCIQYGPSDLLNGASVANLCEEFQPTGYHENALKGIHVYLNVF